MSNWPGATIPSSQSTAPPKPGGYKRFLKLAITMAGLLSIVLVSLSAWNLVKEWPVREQPKVAQDQKELSSPTFEESHPSLFFADLEYNPEKSIATQLKTGKTNGDIPVLLPSPSSSTNLFSYKVEVISKENAILKSGWGYTSRQIASTVEGMLVFRVIVKYEPDAIIQVLLEENRPIWTGRIE